MFRVEVSLWWFTLSVFTCSLLIDGSPLPTTIAELPLVRNQAVSVTDSVNGSRAHDVIENFREDFRNILLMYQKNFLRLIGLVDRNWEDFGQVVRNTSFAVVLDAQKLIAKAYDSTPQFVNRFIQILGQLFGSNSGTQLNQVFNTFRDNLKTFLDVWEAHEHDLHHVLQKTFNRVNSYIDVSPLPTQNLTWT